jgi:nitrous oxidase accessory protein NosD
MLSRSRTFGLAVVFAALLLAGALAATAQAWQGPLVVSAATGNDGNGCTAGAPCRTIGRAVTLASPGDTIVVRSGSYAEQVTVSKRLRLFSDGATIDASGKVNGIVVTGPQASGTSVSGFTVVNAIGEGILVSTASNVTVLRNVVRNNDLGTNTTATPECAPQGEVPGDCGEAVHLMGVADSRVLGNLVEGNVGGILVTDETGPSHGNLIAGNVSRNNKDDCGITLPSHNPMATSDASKAGVYDNTVVDNVTTGNGGAGVGMFAPAPGTASYDNRVVGNVATGNGEAGIAIHAHAPGQNVSGNVIVGNRVAGNGEDPDSGSGHPTGIALFSATVPFDVVVAQNKISDEWFGVFIKGPVTVRGLRSNAIWNVTVPIGRG